MADRTRPPIPEPTTTTRLQVAIDVETVGGRRKLTVTAVYPHTPGEDPDRAEWETGSESPLPGALRDATEAFLSTLLPFAKPKMGY